MIGDDGERTRQSVDALEPNKVLLGFMGQDEAVQHCSAAVFSEPLSEEEILNIWNDAKSGLENSPDLRAHEVDVRELPDTEEVNSYLDQFKATNHFKEVLGGLPEESWEFKMVPLDKLVAFQKIVGTNAYQDIPTSDDGLVSLLEYCLPAGGDNLLIPRNIQSQDGSRVGVQFTSRNPNIGIKGLEYHQVEQDDRPASVEVNFKITSDPNFVQVAKFGGRYILKNGYHRSYHLYKSGEDYIPAVVRSANSYQETGGANPSHFGQQLVMGPRPPLLTDFDTDVAVELDYRGANNIIRVIAEEMTVER